MKKRLIILGAGGQGRVAADIAEKTNIYKSIIFLDDHAESVLEYKIHGKIADFKHYIEKSEFFVAIGNSKTREKFIKTLESEKAEIATLIHPSANIGKNSTIGKGSIVMPEAVIGVNTVIGKGSIINTSASVDHDNIIEDYCHISVGAHLCGTVKIGTHTWIGAGATVINDITICPYCFIGAGAVVVKDLIVPGLYKGLPAVIDVKR